MKCKDVEESIIESINSGEYVQILDFKFSYDEHTEEIKQKKRRYNVNLPSQKRLIKRDAETILLKKYHILRYTNGSKKECSNIISLVVEHKIRYMAYTIIQTMKLGSRYAEAEEYLAKAVVKSYDVIPKFNPWNGLCLGTFLHICIRRDLIAYLKRQNRLETNSDVSLDRMVEDFDIVDFQDNKDICVNILNNAGLTDKQSAIISKLFFSGMREIDIAEDMGVSRQAVNNRYLNAMVKMRKYAEDSGLIY